MKPQRFQNAVIFSTALALFTVFFLIFFFTLLNGYAQNLVAGYRASFTLTLIGIAVELIVVLIFVRGRVRVTWDWLEAAGFAFVVIGVWLYFIAPALPTLLPPSQSSDAVRVYLQAMFSYPEGKLVSWYPAGGAFFVAALAHWLRTPPLYVLHPAAASFLALSAGALYGIACALLPARRVSKISALIAPALLFVPWSYFAGTLNWEQYYFAQVFAQYFILAALWYMAQYAARPHWLLALLIGAALLGVVAAYPIFVALPFGVFALITIVHVARSLRAEGKRALIALGIFLVLMLLAVMALQQGGILEFKAGQISVSGDVGAGGVANPSLDNLGGPLFLALAIIGGGRAWRAGAFGKTWLGLLGIWLVQLIALLVIQPFWQISGYRVDKTFYILVYPLSLFAALALALILDRFAARFESSRRVALAGMLVAIIIIVASVSAWRPPKPYAPFTPSELQTALWAKQHLDTYQINYLDPQPTRAYWLAFGLWNEQLPNEWFQWIPAGTKLGPVTFAEWLNNPAWQPYLLLRDVEIARGAPVQIVYQNGASAIVQKTRPSIAAPTPQFASNIYFGSTLKLLGYDLARTTYAPGDSLTLTTYIESVYPPPATVTWRVQVLDYHNHVVSQAQTDPFANFYPVQRWPAGKFTRDTWTLALNNNLPPGAYALQLGLYRRDTGDAIDAHPLFAELAPQEHFSAATLTQLKIPLPQPSPAELAAATRVDQRVGDAITLLAYTTRVERATGKVYLTLYWQGFGETKNAYTVFVHLLDAHGLIVAQHDAQPRDGTYPTFIWDVGEIITDEYELVVPPTARAPFLIEVGLYTQPNLKRLPIGNRDHIEIKLGDF